MSFHICPVDKAQQGTGLVCRRPGEGKIWNPATYHITSINSDVSVPQFDTNNWKLYNNYRTQALLEPCECDLNIDGSCNMADWLLFGQDWERTDCPVP